MSVYDITYKTLGHTNPGIYTAEDMGEYTPPKKMMELGKKSLDLSSTNPEVSLETHKIFHPEKYLRNQDMVIWDRKSVTITNLGEGMIVYTSMTP